MKRSWLGVVVMVAACGPKTNDDGAADEGSTSAGESTVTSPSEGAEAPGTSAGTSASTSGTTTATTADTGSIPVECGRHGHPPDEECVLFSDCCSCVAHGTFEEPPDTCLADCEQGACEAAGLTEIHCNLGWCELFPVTCDPTFVACDQAAPECATGWLPSVAKSCWGPCVPAHACDFVPDCSWCTAEEICVTYGGIASGTSCEPVPAGCNGDPGVCLCDAICSDMLSTCAPNDGGITCTRTGG